MPGFDRGGGGRPLRVRPSKKRTGTETRILWILRNRRPRITAGPSATTCWPRSTTGRRMTPDKDEAGRRLNQIAQGGRPRRRFVSQSLSGADPGLEGLGRPVAPGLRAGGRGGLSAAGPWTGWLPCAVNSGGRPGGGGEVPEGGRRPAARRFLDRLRLGVVFRLSNQGAAGADNAIRYFTAAIALRPLDSPRPIKKKKKKKKKKGGGGGGGGGNNSATTCGEEGGFMDEAIAEYHKAIHQRQSTPRSSTPITTSATSSFATRASWTKPSRSIARQLEGQSPGLRVDLLRPRRSPDGPRAVWRGPDRPAKSNATRNCGKRLAPRTQPRLRCCGRSRC